MAQEFARDIITTPDVHSLNVPATKTGSGNMRRPAYRSWLARLWGLLRIDAAGQPYREGGTNWENNGPRIDRRKPHPLGEWMKARRRQLSEEQYKALTPNQVDAWFEWLTDLEEHVKAGAFRDGVIPATALIVSNPFLSASCKELSLTRSFVQLAQDGPTIADKVVSSAQLSAPCRCR